MPYNSFVTSVDYWHEEYPDRPIEFLIAFVYMIISFCSECMTNVIVKLVSTHKRIVIGYVLTLGPLIYVTLFHICWQVFSDQSTSLVSLVSACGVAGIGCAIQQSSFYGYSGMLPPRYTQAVMAGESLSGVIVSLDRIVTKLYSRNLQLNTLVFFIMSCVLLFICSLLHQYIKRKKFSLYHTNEKTGPRYHSLINLDGEGQNDGEDVESDSDLSSDSKTESQLVVRVLSRTASDESLELQVFPDDPVSLLDSEQPGKFFSNFLEGVRTRMNIIHGKGLWVHTCAIAGAYLCTLFLFPGFITSVKPLGKNLDYLQRHGVDPSWVPVILVTTYNSCDLCGKILSAYVDAKGTSPNLLLQGCLARFMIVPVYLFCIYPQDNPYFYDVRIPFALTVMLGVSNGYFGSAPMIIAPQVVTTSADRELVGNMMTFSIYVGLTSGSVGAYVVQSVLS